MASGAADGLFRCVYDSCIAGGGGAIERRPYHRNCGCALHKSRGGGGGALCSGHSPSKISFPMRKSWSEGCLALMASVGSSPSSSPAAPTSGRSRLVASSTYSNDDDGGN